MKKLTLSITLALLSSAFLLAEGYKVGDKAADFKLQNIDGNYVSLADYPDASAVKEPYLANALDALLADKDPDPVFTKAIGCSIK